MTILNRKLWAGLLILAAVALVASAAVAGGIEWALASLGMIALISMTCIGICIAVNVSRYSSQSLKGGRLEYGSTSAASCDSEDFKCVTYNKPAKAAPISKKDKSLIMAHIDKLFEIAQEQSEEKPAEAKPISKKDKRLIMAHIDKLFETDWEQSQQILS